MELILIFLDLKKGPDGDRVTLIVLVIRSVS